MSLQGIIQYFTSGSSQSGATEVSLFLAKVLGCYLLIISLYLFFKGDRIQKIAEQFKSNEALQMFSAVVTMILSLLIIVGHNVWVISWPLLITLIGWLGFIKSVVRLFLPTCDTRWVECCTRGKGHYLLGAFWFLIGALLAWAGFIGF